MKNHLKIIFIVFTLIEFTTPIYAQFASLGIKGGLNLSKLSYKDDLQGYDFSFRKGINIGLFTEYQLTDNLLIHSETIYSMRGTEYGSEEISLLGMTIPTHKFVQKLNYFEIPLTIQYNFSINSRITPKVFIGPVASFLLSAKIEYYEEGNKLGEADQKDDIKSFEYGIIIGAGTDYNLATGKIIFDLIYHYGINNINQVQQGSKINSSTLSFNVGYGFKL